MLLRLFSFSILATAAMADGFTVSNLMFNPSGTIHSVGDGFTYTGPLPAYISFTLTAPAGGSIDTSDVVGSIVYGQTVKASAGISDGVYGYGPQGQLQGIVLDDLNASEGGPCTDCEITDRPLGPIFCTTTLNYSCTISSVYVFIDAEGGVDSLGSLTIEGFPEFNAIVLPTPEPESLALLATMIAASLSCLRIRRSAIR